MVFQGSVLESYYMIDIPTDPIELASMLDNYSQDWGITLSFLARVALSRGIILDVDTVSKIMRKKYGIEE